MQHQAFDTTRGVGPLPDEPGRDHGTVVRAQQISGLKVVGEIDNAAMIDRTIRTMVDEESGLITRLGRRAGNQFIRQFVAEIFSSEGRGH